MDWTSVAPLVFAVTLVLAVYWGSERIADVQAHHGDRLIERMDRLIAAIERVNSRTEKRE